MNFGLLIVFLKVHLNAVIVENVGSFKVEAASRAGGDSSEAGCAVRNNVNFNVNAGETKTVTFDSGCTGKYLVVKPFDKIKLTLCRVRVYGTCSSKNAHIKFHYVIVKI